jgi:RecB family exonuclease
MAGVSSVVSSATEQALPVLTEPCPGPVRPLVPSLRVLEPAPQPEAANVLSPTQVRTFLDCSAKWWFRYGLRLPEPKTSSLALGSAVHEALAENFRQKIETREDLDVCGVTALFRQSWLRQTDEAVFQPDEDADQLCGVGEQLVQKYMEEAAPSIDPAGVEFEVTGRIAGVSVRGFVDLMDVHGAIIDVKTAARKPSGISLTTPCSSPPTGL